MQNGQHNTLRAERIMDSVAAKDECPGQHKHVQVRSEGQSSGRWIASKLPQGANFMGLKGYLSDFFYTLT